MAFGAVLFAPKGDGFFGIGAKELFAQAGMAGRRVERGPDAVAVVAVELADLLRDHVVTAAILGSFSLEVAHDADVADAEGRIGGGSRGRG